MSWLAHSVYSHVNGSMHQVTARCSGFTVSTKQVWFAVFHHSYSFVCPDARMSPMDWNCSFPHTNQPSTSAPSLVPALAGGLWTASPSVPCRTSQKQVGVDHRASSSGDPNSSLLACSGQRLSSSDMTPSESAVFSAFQARQTAAHACSYSSPPFLCAAPSLYLWTWTCLSGSLASFLAYAQAEKPNLLPCRAYLCKVHPIFHFWMSPQKPVMVISLRMCLHLLRQSFSCQRSQ